MEVDLGLVQSPEDPRFIRNHHFFCSGKVGGTPAWLSFDPLPPPESLACKVCQDPMLPLLQIYCPIESGREDCFHRSIFVFLCRNPACSRPNLADNLVVFRSQLPRVNPFFAFDPLDPDDPQVWEQLQRPEKFGHICVVCGCRGSKKCGKCQLSWYCSKTHQAFHWKQGHREECKEGLEALNPVANAELLFPEFEIVLEPEDYEDSDEEEEREEQVRMKEYEEFLKKQPTLADPIPTDAGFEEKSNKTFRRFTERVSLYPDQVIRYQRSGQALWAGDNFPSPEDIPDCEKCGSRRIFEFQIMPRLLHYLEVDNVGQSIDWATLAVFTCDNSCALESGSYTSEFVWKQDFTE